MSSHREEKQPKAMDTSIKVALIGAGATLAAALITASISWQQQPPVVPDKRAQGADGRHDDKFDESKKKRNELTLVYSR